MSKYVKFSSIIDSTDVLQIELSSVWTYEWDRMLRWRKDDGVTWIEPLKWCGLSQTLFAQRHVERPWVQLHPSDQRAYMNWLSHKVGEEILK